MLSWSSLINTSSINFQPSNLLLVGTHELRYKFCQSSTLRNVKRLLRKNMQRHSYEPHLIENEILYTCVCMCVCVFEWMTETERERERACVSIYVYGHECTSCSPLNRHASSIDLSLEEDLSTFNPSSWYGISIAQVLAIIVTCILILNATASSKC